MSFLFPHFPVYLLYYKSNNFPEGSVNDNMEYRKIGKTDMETDYIDLGMFFFVDSPGDYAAIFEGELLSYAQDLKKKGIIRAIGADCVACAQCEKRCPFEVPVMANMGKAENSI
jgi:predicted aldo/keto reductase-like oxidoreductase